MAPVIGGACVFGGEDQTGFDAKNTAIAWVGIFLLTALSRWQTI